MADPDNSCLAHTIQVIRDPKIRYVNWPKAGYERTVISGSFTVSRCCYRYASPEADVLEHDISPPTRIETLVFVGEVAMNTGETNLFTFVDGYTNYGGVPIKLKFVAVSSVTSEPPGLAYEYLVQNQGAPFRFTWDFPDQPILQELANSSGLGNYPLAFAPDEETFAFSSYTDALPEVGKPVISILTPAGDPILNITSVAFRPR